MRMHSQHNAGFQDYAGHAGVARNGLRLRLREVLRARRAEGRGLRISLLVLLCVASLMGAGVVQAAHVHDAPISLAAGKHVMLAPADVCPLCAATQAAMAATVQTTVQLLPRVERVALDAGRVRPPARRWSFEMFSRPPPADARS